MNGLAPGVPVLGGVRVLDLTRLLPGNYASLLLVGLGAEVIKVEELTGDGTRVAPPTTAEGESGAHLVLNRGKGSITVNLKEPDGQKLLLALVGTAEVLLDSFRPGVMERLGLGPAELSAANPSLVHVSLTAFGSGGPMQQVPAHDLNAQALAGILSQSVDEDGRPAMPGVQVADMATGLQAALAVMAGLRAVSQGQLGYRVEVAMLDSAMSMTALSAGHMALPNSQPRPRDLLTGALACYGVYRTADDRWVAVGGLEPKFFVRMCELMEVPELAAWQYDLKRQDELRQRLANVFVTADQDHWVALLSGEDTCVSPVNDIREAFDEPDARARGAVTEASTACGQRFPVVSAVPWLADPSPLVAPSLGSDTLGVLERLGITAEQVSDLQARGIVGGPS